MKKKLAVTVLSLIIIVGAATLLYNKLSKEPISNAPVASKTQEPKQEKIKITDFTMSDKDKKTYSLSEFLGKPMVVNFWASWCPPCKGEFPEFQEVFDKSKDDVNFLMINLTDGQRETMDLGAKFILDNGYTLPVYYDINEEAAYGYKISSIPLTIFVDSDGYITKTYNRRIDKSILTQEINKLTGK